jgi:hypothetical protein
VRMWCTTGGSNDPMVMVGGVAYRVTPAGPPRYLVTRQRDGVRIGFFRLARKNPWRVDAVPEPDDPGAAELVREVGLAMVRARVDGWR